VVVREDHAGRVVVQRLDDDFARIDARLHQCTISANQLTCQL
jgi:hypothetical protein